jgi:hypothetical protein
MFLSISTNIMIISGPHYLNFSPAFCKISKNVPYILRKVKKSHNILKYRDHSYLFCKMYGLKLKWWGPLISISLADLKKIY